MSEQHQAGAVPAQDTPAPPAAGEGPGALVIEPVLLGLITSLVTNAFADLPPTAGILLALVLGLVYWRLRGRRVARPEPGGVSREARDESADRSRSWRILAAIALVALVVSVLAVVLAGAAITLVVVVCVWLLALLVGGALAQGLSETLQPLVLQLVAVGVGASVGVGAQPLIEEATDSQRQLSDPVLLGSGLSPTSATPEVAADGDGVVHVLWHPSVRGIPSYEITARHRAPEEAWSSEELLSEAEYRASGLHVTRRPSGEVCALWDAYLDVVDRSWRLWERCFVDSAWTPRREVGAFERGLGGISSEMVSTYTPAGNLETVLLSPPGDVLYGPQELTGRKLGGGTVFLADGQGRLHAIWDEGSLVHRMSDDGGRTWTPARPLELSFEGAIDVAADGQGRVHLVTAGMEEVLYARWTDTGWEPERELNGPLPGTIYPGIGVGPDGRATAAWSIPDGLAVAMQRADGSFEAAEVVRDPLLGGDGRVQVAVDDDGFRQIVVLLADGRLVHVELEPPDD